MLSILRTVSLLTVCPASYKSCTSSFDRVVWWMVRPKPTCVPWKQRIIYLGRYLIFNVSFPHQLLGHPVEDHCTRGKSKSTNPLELFSQHFLGWCYRFNHDQVQPWRPDELKLKLDTTNSTIQHQDWHLRWRHWLAHHCMIPGLNSIADSVLWASVSMLFHPN